MEKHLTPEKAHILLQVTKSTVYLMGASFVLGVAVTLLLLLLLDFIRRNKPPQS